MGIALALLVVLNLAIAAGMFGLYRLVPSWWPYWIALAVTLAGAPEHLMSALRALSEEDGVAPGDLRDFAALEALCTVGRRRRLELLMDHPPLEKRLAQLAELARELGKPA
jgi:hypothetical protein